MLCLFCHILGKIVSLSWFTCGYVGLDHKMKKLQTVKDGFYLATATLNSNSAKPWNVVTGVSIVITCLIIVIHVIISCITQPPTQSHAIQFYDRCTWYKHWYTQTDMFRQNIKDEENLSVSLSKLHTNYFQTSKIMKMWNLVLTFNSSKTRNWSTTPRLLYHLRLYAKPYPYWNWYFVERTSSSVGVEAWEKPKLARKCGDASCDELLIRVSRVPGKDNKQNSEDQVPSSQVVWSGYIG